MYCFDTVSCFGRLAFTETKQRPTWPQTDQHMTVAMFGSDCFACLRKLSLARGCYHIVFISGLSSVYEPLTSLQLETFLES